MPDFDRAIARWGIGFGFEFVLRFVKVRRPAGIVSENGMGLVLNSRLGAEFLGAPVRRPAWMRNCDEM